MHRFLLALALIVIAQPAAAQPAAPGFVVAGTVGFLLVDETSFGVGTDSPILNPANCPTPDSYRSSFIRELYYGTALTAFAMTASITITIHESECANGRPKIVGIVISRQNAPDLSGRINTISNRLDSISNHLDKQDRQAVFISSNVISTENRVNRIVDDIAATQSNIVAVFDLGHLIARKVGAEP